MKNNIADLSAHNSVNYLLRRVLQCNFPLSTYFISCIVSNGTVIPGTLVDRVLQCGLSPVKCALFLTRGLKMPGVSLEWLTLLSRLYISILLNPILKNMLRLLYC